jgi:glycerol-3-phosphate dehydrogenase (NAD(P)+)
MNKILVVGAGEIGMAIKEALNPEVPVSLWDKNPQKCSVATLAEALQDADYIFMCVPTRALDEALKEIVPLSEDHAFFISPSKGMDRRLGKFGFEIMREYLPEKRYGILSGPMLSEEFSGGDGSGAIFATANRDAFESLQSLFKSRFIILKHSTDILGTALSGVLKNVYTLALGIAEGLGWKNNLKGVLFAKSVSESLIIAKKFGAETNAALDLAGLGDFYATSTSSYSANRTSGIRLASKGERGASEGLNALLPLYERVGETEDLPLLEALYDIVENGAEPRERFETLIYEK